MNISTNLKRTLSPKKTYRNQRTRNYFYRMFDNIGSQLAVINQGLKDSGPKRTWQLSK